MPRRRSPGIYNGVAIQQEVVNVVVYPHKQSWLGYKNASVYAGCGGTKIVQTVHNISSVSKKDLITLLQRIQYCDDDNNKKTRENKSKGRNSNSKRKIIL